MFFLRLTFFRDAYAAGAKVYCHGMVSYAYDTKRENTDLRANWQIIATFPK